MSAAEHRFRCAPASLERDDPVAGTATHVRTWVLLEHSGPWGSDALLDARLPDGLGPALKQRARALRAKILLVRRARARTDPERLNVFAAFADPQQPRIEHGTVTETIGTRSRSASTTELRPAIHSASEPVVRRRGPPPLRPAESLACLALCALW